MLTAENRPGPGQLLLAGAGVLLGPLLAGRLVKPKAKVRQGLLFTMTYGGRGDASAPGKPVAIRGCVGLQPAHGCPVFPVPAQGEELPNERIEIGLDPMV